MMTGIFSLPAISGARADGYRSVLSVGAIDRDLRFYGTLGRLPFDDADLTVATFAGDYVFAYGDVLRPYIGLSAGYGRQKWTENVPFDEDRMAMFDGESGEGFIFGFQAGVLLEFNRHWQMDIGGRGYYSRISSSAVIEGFDVAHQRLETLNFMHVSLYYQF
ncbi:hypothetical protein [Natronospira sp.]|uniref:hypothetical protein n=1 Tax=Natronospira sp. TaxID=2024970 RepID=UPI0038733B24